MSKVKAIVLGLCWLGLSTAAMAQELTPATFVQADIEARQTTLEGMAARLAQLQQGADLDSQAQLSEQNQAAVEATFERFGTDAAGHAAYGTQHREAIAAWLAANPPWQQQYDELTAQFEALSQQFDASAGENP